MYKLSSTVKSVLRDPTFWGLTAPVLVGTGVAYATSGIDKVLESRNKAKAYKEMLESNPQLRKMDSNRVQAYFNSMYRVSPELAKDPYVAGAWVHNVIDNQDPHDTRPNYALLSAVQNLAQPSSHIMSARRNRRGTADTAIAVARPLQEIAREGLRVHERLQADESYRKGFNEGRNSFVQKLRAEQAERRAIEDILRSNPNLDNPGGG